MEHKETTHHSFSNCTKSNILWDIDTAWIKTNLHNQNPNLTLTTLETLEYTEPGFDCWSLNFNNNDTTISQEQRNLTS